MIKLSVGISLTLGVLKGCGSVLAPDVVHDVVQLGVDVAEAETGIDLDKDGDIAGNKTKE